MSEHSDFVKRIASRYVAQALRTSNAANAKELTDTADGLGRAAREMDRLTDLTTAIPRPLGPFSDLPPSLVAELSSVKVDELEDQVVTVINAFDGVANIDEILVGLYRKFKVEQTRKFMLNKLYRMTKSDLIYSLPGRKGVYSTKPPPEGAEAESEEEDEVPSFDDPPRPAGKMGNPTGQIGKRRSEQQLSRPDFDDEIPF